MTLVEIVASIAILAVAILAAIAATNAASRRLVYAKELEIAKLAVQRARESLSAVRFRGATQVDDGEWLFRGGYEVARNADGSSFLLPDLRNATKVTVDGMAGVVAVEFPVPPLAPAEGRTLPGRIVLFIDETAQPASIPTATFPFEPTSGMTKLDCDGDGAATTTDLRTRHAQSVAPCRLVPARIEVRWRSTLEMESSYEESFLLAFQGVT